jgi:hypothetical protein
VRDNTLLLWENYIWDVSFLKWIVKNKIYTRTRVIFEPKRDNEANSKRGTRELIKCYIISNHARLSKLDPKWSGRPKS